MRFCQAASALAALTVILLLISPAEGNSKERLVQLSVINPVQLFPEEDSVTGLRFNLIYGKNTAVTGLDIGLVNHTSSGTMAGLQYGLVGIADSDFVGWQDNSVNVVRGFCKGMQWGVVNYAREMKGFQLGLVNYTWNMEGLQLGLINVIREGAFLPVLPLLNWSF